MIRKFLFFSLGMMIGTVTWSQYLEPQQRDEHPLMDNLWNAKVDVSNIVNPKDPSLLMSLEYMFNNNLSFSQELGGILGNRQSEDSYGGFKGVKVREELRMYLTPLSFENGYTYISVNALYRFLNMGNRVTLGYDCTDDSQNSCSYLKQATTDLKSSKYGGAVRFGMMKPVSSRLTLEADFGLSLQYQNLTNDYHQDVHIFMNNSFLNQEQTGWSFEPSFSAKIGFVLSKKKRAASNLE